jgi:hypothetical protein
MGFCSDVLRHRLTEIDTAVNPAQLQYAMDMPIAPLWWRRKRWRQFLSLSVALLLTVLAAALERVGFSHRAGHAAIGQRTVKLLDVQVASETLLAA